MLGDTSIHEAAKYPWSVEARKLVKQLDISLSEVDGNSLALRRARQRLIEALDVKHVSTPDERVTDEFAELTSFFVAKALVDAVKSIFLRRRWATAEAKRAHHFFLRESDRRLALLAKRNFGWNINSEVTRIAGREFSHSLHFSDYLAAASGFQDRYWKLVNKRMVDGYVLLRKPDTARVLAAAVELLLIKDVKKVSAPFPPNIQQVYEEVEAQVRSRTDRLQQEVRGALVPEAFPPCMKALLADLEEGRPLSHIARFTITSFLLHVGMNVEDILDLFRKAPDFREDIARYQIEHIAGKRGSTEYTPPSCAYLDTVHLCVGKDRLCKAIRHPLSYYRRRRRWLSKQQPS